MATTKKPTEDNKNILDESENADIVNEFLDENAKDDKGLKEVIKLINQNPDFAKELQAILAKFRSSSLIQTQAEILLLLKEVIDNFLSGNYSLDDENQLDGKQKEKLKGRLVEMSQILMQQNLLQVRLEQKETGVAKDKYEYIAPEAYNSLKVTLKRLVVYEMYKVLSPKRIAGETHRDNFIGNAILRGMKTAIKYEPKVAEDLEKSSPNLIPELAKQHKQVKSTKGLEL